MRLSWVLFAFLWCFVMVTSAGVQASELVAAWSFDDGTDTVRDVTGNGYDGVIRDAVYVDGKMGTALEFDGATSSVEVEHGEALNIEDALTVEAWVNPSSFNDLSAVAQKWGDTTNRRQYLLCFVGAKVRMYISGSGGTWPSAESTSQVPTNDWTHIAGTYDSEAIKVYINGKLETETANAEGLFGSEIPVWIGGYGPDAEFDGNRHFPGIIDEVRFWAGALSEDEIAKGMNESAAALAPKGKLGTLWGTLKNR